MSAATPVQQRTIGVVAAAAMLDIAPKTIRKWLGSGKLRKVKLGGRVLIEMSEIDRLVADGRVASTPTDNG